MPQTTIHPLALDSLAVLLIAPLTESLSVEELAILGSFFCVLGDLLALNSSYLSAFQSPEDLSFNPQEEKNTNQNNKFELLKESFQKLEKQLNQLKEKC